jgi:hypothetical protein
MNAIKLIEPIHGIIKCAVNAPNLGFTESRQVCTISQEDKNWLNLTIVLDNVGFTKVNGQDG